MSKRNYEVSSPVVLFIFNRPDLTRLVFNQIRSVKPKILFVVSDGSRDVQGERELVEECRKIATSIDWECDLITDFSNENLGCKHRIISGIYNVFNRVDQAIFLEDDCLPNNDFFKFMDVTLDRFKSDHKIGMVAGTNIHSLKHMEKLEADLYASKYSHIWGWGTWSDRWLNVYDQDLKSWPKIKKDKTLKEYLHNNDEYRYWKRIFQEMHSLRADTWDYQWTYANFVNSRKSIVSKMNLVTNLGFDRKDATHTKQMSVDANKPAFELPKTLNLFIDLSKSEALDEIESLRYRKNLLIFRVVRKIVRKLSQYKPE